MYEATKNGVKKVSSIFEARFPKTANYTKKHKRRILWIAPIVLFLIYLIVKPKGIDKSLITVVPVQNQNLVSAVKSSGKVTSVVDLNLSFKTADVVSRVNVSVGDKVKRGQVLATLDVGNENAAVTQARGTLSAAQATFKKVKEGATTEELKVAQVAYDNAVRDLEKTKSVQESLVNNARRILYSSYLEAKPEPGNASTGIPTISGSYTGSTEATYTLDLYSTSGGGYYTVSGTSTSSGPTSNTQSQPLGTDGLLITFPSGFSGSGKWVVSVPNKSSAYYTTNSNAYASAIQNKDLAISQAQSVVDARKADLDLKSAGARSADVDLAQANVLSAQGAYENAVANLEKKILRAPADGTVTKIDLKIGELAKALETVAVIQDVGHLYVESDVNESSITNVQNGQPVVFTIDAFGPSKTFTGSVTQVEPSATIKDGIVNYKIKASINEADPNIKPGMNANLVVTTGTKENVIAIPGAAITKRDNATFANVITNEKKKSYVERQITTGIVGDGNMTEVVSGLNAGEKIALIEKKK